MISRVLVVGVLLAGLLVVQTVVLPVVSVAGYRPDVVLLLVIAVAVVDGAEPGARVGFAGGLLSDLLLQSSAVGVAALSYALVGYCIGLARPYLAPQSSTAPFVLAFGGTLLGQLLLGLLGRVLGGEPAPLRLIVTASVLAAVLHTLLVPFALRVARSLSQRFPAEASAVAR